MDGPGDMNPAPSTALVAKTRVVKPLANSRLRTIRSSEADIGNLFAAVCESGTRWEEDVLAPEFWSNHAAKMRVGDTIEVHCDSQLFFGRLLVRAVSGTGGNKTRVSVAQLEFHEFEKLSVSAEPVSHTVMNKGPHLKWCIVRLSDSKIVGENHETREAAEAAMRGMLRVAA